MKKILLVTAFIGIFSASSAFGATNVDKSQENIALTKSGQELGSKSYHHGKGNVKHHKKHHSYHHGKGVHHHGKGGMSHEACKKLLEKKSSKK